MPASSQTTTDEHLVSISRFAILLALCLWCFRDQLAYMVRSVGNSSETAHAMIMPLVLALLVYLRRDHLTRGLGAGSVWGIVLVVFGLVLHALAYWPFPYGYAHYVAIVPVVAGVVLLCCGRRVLRLSLPMILLLWLSFPIGSRIHASLVMRPNTYTLSAAAKTLDLLPGVDASADGGDLVFTAHEKPGVVGLGEANRGARLMFAYAAIGLFVAFSRVRPVGRLIVLMVLGLPLVLFCNFIRFLLWALVTVYGGFGPVSSLPRDASTVLSLLFAYGLFAFLCGIRIDLFVEEDEACEKAAVVEGSR